MLPEIFVLYVILSHSPSLIIFFCYLFLVNLRSEDKVDITHFDLIKILGTGGE